MFTCYIINNERIIEKKIKIRIMNNGLIDINKNNSQAKELDKSNYCGRLLYAINITIKVKIFMVKMH